MTPVSIEADLPFGFASVPVDVTNTEGRALCVAMSSAACAQTAGAGIS